MQAKHESVLAEEVMEALSLSPQETAVDATIGGAGHFAAMLAALGKDGTLVGIDADPAAVERGRQAYAEDRRSDRPVTHVVNDNFRNFARILERLNIGHVDAVLFDLGWSGYQIASLRGFSFQGDEPLYMTYAEGGESAAELVNSLSEKKLADLIYAYGEEHFARPIARAIVKKRAIQRILTTKQLVDAIESGTPKWYREGKIHPATRTFQALRIAVNDEIGALKEGLGSALAALAPGGRMAVITFHSIEDRVVKNMLQDAADRGIGTLSPKKPILPCREEVVKNRRARSAKLRVFKRAPLSTVAEPGRPQLLYCYV